MIRAVDSSWTIIEINGNSPQRDMAPKPLFKVIVWAKSLTTDTAGQLSPFLGIQFNPQFIFGQVNRNNKMILDSNSKMYDTCYEDGAAPLSCIWDNTLTNGIDSCFQLLNPIYEHKFS